MSHEQQHHSPEHQEAIEHGQQQQQPPSERHAGQGSDSILKELHEWEQRRFANSGGKRRDGAG